MMQGLIDFLERHATPPVHWRDQLWMLALAAVLAFFLFVVIR